MKKEYDALVFIARAQPFHDAHKEIIERALSMSKQVIVLLGSASSARTLRNPWTFEERREMISETFPTESDSLNRRLRIVPLEDYPYNDGKWIAAVRHKVMSSIHFSPDPLRIGLIGHAKDNSSYYLKMFPGWESENVENLGEIDATYVRDTYFKTSGGIIRGMGCLPESTMKFLSEFKKTDDFSVLIHEYEINKAYKKSWEVAPFPPTFVTVDTIVTQSGHVLLVKRKSAPGKGLWALPGGFINQNEKILDAALRELKEETKLKVPVSVLKGSIEGSGVFDNPNRSSRGRTITHAYHINLGFDVKLPKVTGADDAEKAVWVPFDEVQKNKMFEDHYGILDYFLNLEV